MRGSLFRKNVIKDYFERTYATALVMIAFLLFLDAMLFIISRGVVQSGEGTEYLVKNFSFMGGNLFMAMAFPAIMMWMLLGGCFDRGAGDLYQSLPPARREMFSGAVCVITGYEVLFLLLQMLLRLFLIGITKGFCVRKYFYWSVTGFSFSVYLLFLGITIICFSTSASALGFFGRTALWAVILWMVRDGFSAIYEATQFIYFDREFDVSRMLPVKLATTGSIIGERIFFDEIKVGTEESEWELGIAWDSGLFMAVFGAVLLLVSWFLFRKRPAERTDGRNRSEAMHVCLQTVAFGAVLMCGLSVIQSYQYLEMRDIVRNYGWRRLVLRILEKGVPLGIPVILFFCVWEWLYRKKLKEIPKVWKGVVFGTLFAVICVTVVFITFEAGW